MFSIQSIFGKKMIISGPLPVVQELVARPEISGRAYFDGRFDQVGEALALTEKRMAEMTASMRIATKEMMAMREQIEELKEAGKAQTPEVAISDQRFETSAPPIEEGWMTAFQFLKSLRYPAKTSDVRSISRLAKNIALTDGVRTKTYKVSTSQVGRVARCHGVHALFPINILQRAVAARFPSAVKA